MIASMEGSAGVVELLIQQGAQLDIKNKVAVAILSLLWFTLACFNRKFVRKHRLDR